ncbi:MAG: sigma 54-dependent Fis family transcriptional regulator [Deltaproteobacteria bacterium]|nr:MAG: sigma 54-dependent Fis family transcriptional regulator [Deltaproteobacteria bacterium]
MSNSSFAPTPYTPLAIPKTIEASPDSFHSSIRLPNFRLVVTAGPHESMEFPLQQEIIRIGRREWCDVVLDQDLQISGEHCECWLGPDGVRLRDLNSRNGIYLQDSRIYDALIAPGLPFTMGNSTLELRTTNELQELEISYLDPSQNLVGRSESMRKIFAVLRRLSQRDVTVLLTGETGVGKTSIAKALHDQSNRAEGPFITVNCGAVPESLFEASLMGYEKGAFTGAAQRYKGLFEQAHKGTLFLDEVGELPLALQPKLLDVLERKKVRRLGGAEEIDTDFRLVVATNRSLQEEVRENRFRSDLYYRVAVVDIQVPPLRERIEDLPLLVMKMLRIIQPDETIQVAPETFRMMRNYLWPGNIRQLRNALERAIAFLDPGKEPVITNDVFYIPDMEEALDDNVSVSESPAPPNKSPTLTLPTEPTPLKHLLEPYERQLILLALEQHDWLVAPAAEHLCVSSSWLYNRIKKYGLQREDT